mgnify:CR=1 FL=1
MERKPWQFPREGMLHLVRELLVRKTANFDHDDPAERIVELIDRYTEDARNAGVREIQQGLIKLLDLRHLLG